MSGLRSWGVGRSAWLLLTASLLLGGCVGSAAATDCRATDYAGGTLEDCAETSTFVPDTEVPVAYFVWNPLETFVPDPKFVVVPQCTRTEVPEGLWTACSDGYSHLQRRDAAETLAARARVQSLKTMATVRRTLRGLADIVLKTGDTKCRALGIEVRAYVESWYPQPHHGVRPIDRETIARELQPEVEFQCIDDELIVDLDLPLLEQESEMVTMDRILRGLRDRNVAVANPEIMPKLTIRLAKGGPQ